MLVVAAGWLLRIWPALSFGDWWRVPAGYDDSENFAESALLWSGEMPYRDFVLVHPPGFLVLLGPISSLTGMLGPAQAFSAARWVMTLAGAASIALSARIAYRAAGPIAAVAAAFVYAVLPEATSHERTTFLEPFLNLACLLCANAWLTARPERGRRGFRIAGLWLGIACSVKLWAVLWAGACLLTLPRPASAEDDRAAGPRSGRLWALGWLAAGATIGVLVLVGPFALLSPGAFFTQVFRFQLERPPDGMPIGLDRLVAMLDRSWPVIMLAAIGLTACRLSFEPALRRSARFFGAVWLFTLATFSLSASYWPHYNAFFAPAVAHLAGLGVVLLWRRATDGRVARLVTVAVLVAAGLVPLRSSIERAREGGDLFERVGERVRAIPLDECYIAFEPIWALAGDRLPSVRPDGSSMVDVYAVMLLDAAAGPRARASAGNAIRSTTAQARLREILADCEYLSLGERGELQITPSTARWIRQRWERLPAIDHTGVDLWRLRR